MSEEETKQETQKMVILFDPNIGVSFMDHNVDDELAAIRVERLREQKLPAFTLVQSVNHESTPEEMADCIDCRNQFVAAMQEMNGGAEVNLQETSEEE